MPSIFETTPQCNLFGSDSFLEGCCCLKQIFSWKVGGQSSKNAITKKNNNQLIHSHNKLEGKKL